MINSYLSQNETSKEPQLIPYETYDKRKTQVHRNERTFNTNLDPDNKPWIKRHTETDPITKNRN